MLSQIDERKNLKYRQDALNDNLIKRLELYGTLDAHEGCVNSIQWNYQGTQLVSVSDDCQIIIWDPFRKKKLQQFHSQHTGNIFAVKFLELNHDNLLVTGAADYKCIVHDIVASTHVFQCNCHKGRVKKIATTAHDSSLVFTAGEDGLVLQLDVREKHNCHDNELSNALIDLKTYCTSSSKVTSVACNSVRNEQIAIGSNDQFVRLYDRRMIKPMPITSSTKDDLSENCVTYFTIGSSSNKRKHGNTSACTNLSFSITGDELLANFSSDHIYLFDVLKTEKPKIFQTDLFDVFGNPDNHNESSFNEDFNYSESSRKSEASTNPVQNSTTKDLNNDQMPSTSRLQCDEDIEMKDAIEDKSRQLIDSINRNQNPNLMTYKAKAKLPKHISSIVKNATSFIKKEKYSDAIYLLNELINTMPNVSRFYCLRGTCLSKRNFNNDLYCALKDFYKSLQIDPNNKESHLKLGQCLHDLGFYESAYQCLNYFRTNQSKDTRYKQFKELENLIQASLKKKPTENKRPKKLALSCRKMVQEFTREYFTLAQNASSSSASNNTPAIASRSTSNIPSSSSSSSLSLNSWSSSASSVHESEEMSDTSNTSFDSDAPSSKHIKNKKELDFRARSCDFKQRYLGHCNVSTDIMEANFFGSNNQYIIGGSDDGNFYIWNRHSTNIVNIIKGDECIVNCVQPHHNSCFIATSGIDNCVKLWSPTLSEDKVEEAAKKEKSSFMKKMKENQRKMNSSNSNSYGIMFLRVTNLNNEDSDDDHSLENSLSFRQASIQFRDCVLS